MKDKLDEIIAKHGAKHWSRAAKKDEQFMNEVTAATTDLPASTPIAERVYCAVSSTRPECPRGGKRTLKSVIDGWRFCGPAGRCPCAREAVSEKSKNNVDHAARLAKTRATLVERYGTDNPGQTPRAKAAHKAFYSDRAKVDLAVARGKATMLERHGVQNALSLPSIDRLSISRVRSGVSEEAAAILDDSTRLSVFMETRSVTTAADELDVCPTTITRYLRNYGISVGGSSYENEIAAFLDQHGIRYKRRDRTAIRPFEADFLLPDHGLIVEFNGLYWHTEEVVGNDYHRRKYLTATAAGYRMLMVNEDEYVGRRRAIENKILNLCGFSDRGVGARKLVISEIDIASAQRFTEKHHIQGRTSTVWRAYGAFQGEEMRGAVILGKQRGTGTIELTRFCTSGAIHAGLLSRFLSHIRKTVNEEIVTFADLRYSDGNVYRRTGFVETGEVRPDYRYAKGGKTYHKSLFTKKRIAKRFGIDVSSMTEKQAMRSLGYSRIYDCGKLRFVLPSAS